MSLPSWGTETGKASEEVLPVCMTWGFQSITGHHEVAQEVLLTQLGVALIQLPGIRAVPLKIGAALIWGSSGEQGFQHPHLGTGGKVGRPDWPLLWGTELRVILAGCVNQCL